MCGDGGGSSVVCSHYSKPLSYIQATWTLPKGISSAEETTSTHITDRKVEKGEEVTPSILTDSILLY